MFGLIACVFGLLVTGLVDFGVFVLGELRVMLVCYT